MRSRRTPKVENPQEAGVPAVFDNCAHVIKAHLKSLLGDEAEADDLTQETFIRYLAFVRRGGRARSSLQILYTTATHLAIRHMRRYHWRKEQSAYLPKPEPASDEPRFRAWTLLESIWNALDAKGKVVAKAMLADEMTDSEIVAYTGIPHTTVQRKVKIIQSLAKKMGAS